MKSIIEKGLCLIACFSIITSCSKEFQRQMAVQTLSVDPLTSTAKGKILDLGYKEIIQHGFVYDSINIISTNSLKVELGNVIKTGNFEAILADLQPNKQYYVISFLTNSDETIYGEQISFLSMTHRKPEVRTDSITYYTDTSAVCKGTVISDGGKIVTARGVCWNTLPNPTIDNNHTTDGNGTGTFLSNLTGLVPDRLYYVRAYATNSIGTAYGNEISFTTHATTILPTVTTDTATNITQTTATSGGNVISDGGTTVTVRGVCWSTLQNPTISDSHTDDGSGTGIFTSNLTGLDTGTTYYVRAYATNSSGTGYGTQEYFTTRISNAPPCPGLPTITDSRDGQVYPTVQIGTQCWLQKNMNYQTGNSWCYDNNVTRCNTYGRLYDWQTAIGVCPSGWHLPSDAELTTLTTYLGGTSVAGGKMKEAGTSHWTSPNNGATNSSGFTALPGGWLDSGSFSNLGGWSYFWSSTQYDDNRIWIRDLIYFDDYVGRYYAGKNDGFSVRCLQD